MPEPFDNLVIDIIAGLIVAAMLAALGCLWRRGDRRPAPLEPPQPPSSHSLTVRADDRAVTLQNVRVAGDLNIYLDRLPEAAPQVRDHFEEGRRLQTAEQHRAAVNELETAFAAADNDSQRCALHLLIGNSFALLGELNVAEGHYNEALMAAQRGGDAEGEARAIGNLGGVYLYRGDLERAEERYKQALPLFEQVGNRGWVAAAIGNLGSVYLDRGDLQKAEEHYADALAAFEHIGNQEWRAVVVGNLGNVYYQRGDLHKAEEHYRKALAMDEEIGNRRGQAADLGNLGNVYRRRGDLDNAEECHKKALAIDEEIGNKLGQATDLLNLALLAEERGEVGKARGLLNQAKALYDAAGAGGRGPDNVRRALERLGPPAGAPDRPASKPKASRKRRPPKKR